MPMAVGNVFRWLLMYLRAQPGGRGVAVSGIRRTGGLALVLSSVTFVILALIYGLGGEWRAVGFFSFAAIGFWLGAQEVLGG